MNINLMRANRRHGWAAFSFAAVVFALAAIVAPGCALTQEKNTDDARRAQMPASNYRQPSAREQFRQYLRDTYGPSAFVEATVMSSIDQARNAPPEWKQGGQGFAERFGSNFGKHAITETTRYGMASALRLDTSYERCACSGVFPRLGHSLLSSVTARKANGSRILSIPSLMAPYAGSFAATDTWYPDRFGPKDGFRSGTFSLGIHTGLNILWEFIPSRR
jgi:hypothetical protein